MVIGDFNGKLEKEIKLICSQEISHKKLEIRMANTSLNFAPRKT